VTEKKSSAHRQRVHKEENPGFIPPSSVVNPQPDLDKARCMFRRPAYDKQVLAVLQTFAPGADKMTFKK
jgi:hypothetical protein